MGTRMGAPPMATLLGIPLFLIITASPALAGADSEKDAQIVYCLSSEHRPALIEAAVNLGIGRSVTGDPTRLAMDVEPAKRAELGPEVTRTAEQLRREKPKDFDRACAALIKANSKPSGDGGGSNPLIGLLTSAFLTLLGAGTVIFTQQVDRRAIRRDERIKEAEAATASYELAVENYLSLWEDDRNPSHQSVADTREALLKAIDALPLRGEHQKIREDLSTKLPLKGPLPVRDSEEYNSIYSQGEDNQGLVKHAKKERIKLNQALTDIRELTRISAGSRTRSTRQKGGNE